MTRCSFPVWRTQAHVCGAQVLTSATVFTCVPIAMTISQITRSSFPSILTRAQIIGNGIRATSIIFTRIRLTFVFIYEQLKKLNLKLKRQLTIAKEIFSF